MDNYVQKIEGFRKEPVYRCLKFFDDEYLWVIIEEMKCTQLNCKYYLLFHICSTKVKGTIVNYFLLFGAGMSFLHKDGVLKTFYNSVVIMPCNTFYPLIPSCHQHDIFCGRT